MSKKKQLKTVVNNNIVAINEGQAISPIQAAMQSGASPAELLQFMELQERFDSNEAKKAYFLAMSKFRAVCPTIEKTEKGHNCTYASIAGTMRQIKTLLGEHELFPSWRVTQKDNLITITCIVAHALGYSEETSITAPPDTAGSIKGIQGIGSTITYLERYTLTALLGLASGDKDDDGQSAIVERITEDQALTIHSMITENDIEMNSVLNWLRTSLKCSGIEDINVNAYEGVINKVKATIKNQQQRKSDASNK